MTSGRSLEKSAAPPGMLADELAPSIAMDVLIAVELGRVAQEVEAEREVGGPGLRSLVLAASIRPSSKS
jgi:hypothetical protein